MSEQPDTTWEEVDNQDARKVAYHGRIKIVHSNHGASITVYHDDQPEPSHIRIFITPAEAQFIADTLGA